MMRIILRIVFGVIGAVGAISASSCALSSLNSPAQGELARRAQATLVDVLERDDKFIKVHAAEILSARGEKDRVRGIFERELERNGTTPGYRVGIWRVLAGTARDDHERAQWIARISAAFLDPTATDRIGAIESLGKLGHRVDADVRRAALTIAESGSPSDGMFAWWALHLVGEPRALRNMVAGLSSAEPVARLRAAYAIRWERIRDANTLSALARAAGTEPRDAVGHAIITSAAFSLDADPSRSVEWRARLDEILTSGAPGDRYQACLLLSEKFSAGDLPRLTPLLDHENGDVRVGAATAILAVLERGGRG